MNFSLSEIKESGEKNINRKIISRLNLKKENDNIVKYNFIEEAKKNKEIIWNGIANDKIKVVIGARSSDVQDSTLIFKEKVFLENFTYNNSDNKFNLSQYTKIIEENLIEKISKDMVIFLNS